MELQVGGYGSQRCNEAVTACCDDGRHDISHEWEELLYKLSLVDDPKMRDFASKEMARIRTASQGVRFFDLGETGSPMPAGNCA